MVSFVARKPANTEAVNCTAMNGSEMDDRKALLQIGSFTTLARP